jgi:ribonuclease HI
LPTKQNLLRKGVVDNDFCPCCQLEGESVVHALWCCPAAQDVWGCGPVWCQKSPSFFLDMVDLVSYLLSKLNADLLSLGVVVLHRIWLRRNKFIFDGQFVPPLKVFLEASQLLEDFNRCNLREPFSLASNDDSSRSCSFWDPPVAGLVKINWDASLNISSAVVGMGCVIRDANGFVLAAKCGVSRAVAEPVCAEAMATLFALEFCNDLGYVNVVSEGDSLQVIKAITDSEYHLHKIGHFLEAINLRANDFSVCKWSHCARDANEVAHLLARRAAFYGLCNVWTENISLFISSASFRDFLVSRL